MLRGLLQTKGLDEILATAQAPGASLKRTLGALDVTLLGIGAIVGAGIFATIGTAAAGDAARPGAGPSLVLSFMITGVVSGFTALCYAELASMVPIAGSAYTYAYATLGELVAWIIGWDLILEYAVGNVAVAISWGNYFRVLLETIGIDLPVWLCTDYRSAAAMPGILEQAPHVWGQPIVFNLPAFAIVAVLTIVLVWGIKESVRLNAVMVAIKIVVLLLFIGAGLWFVSPRQMVANWTPFQPSGWPGTLAAAAVVFFAYVGFDAISTVSEEVKDPRRDLPAGILGSLAVCTILYIVVSAVFTGLVSHAVLARTLVSEQAEPLTFALEYVAPQAKWTVVVVAIGSLMAHTAVLLVFQLGQPRIFFAMARDGLLPPSFARVHPRFRTPHVTTIATGIVVGVCAAVASIDEMVDLTNIGTLFAFTLVCAAIPVLRQREPDRERGFSVPGGAWTIPILGALSCIGLMIYLPPISWWRFVGWLTVGLAIYTSYGYCHSVLGRTLNRAVRPPLILRCGTAGFLLAAYGLLLSNWVLTGVGVAVGAMSWVADGRREAGGGRRRNGRETGNGRRETTSER